MKLAQQTVLIIDDHRLFADGLSVLLRQMDAALNVTTEYSAQKVLFVSGNEELPDVEHALRLGARGYIPKSLPSAEMVTAIKKVLNGDLFLPHNWDESINWAACNPKFNTKKQTEISVAGLRPRQIEVLELMHKGHTNLKIASILGISESAVKSHISILFKALDTKNRTAAIKAGLEQALIE